MLLPVRISEPDAVSVFEVLVREGGEEFIHAMAFGVVAEVVGHPCKYDHRDDDRDDQLSSAPHRRLIVLLSIH